MHTSRIFLACSLLALVGGANAQTPAKVALTSLLGQAPIPGSSSSCYASCNKSTSSDGVVTIIDNGEPLKSANEHLKNVSTSGMIMPSASGTTPPTQAQIEQMQAEATQRAMQAQQSSANQPPASGVYSKDHLALMRDMGNAQSAMSTINSLVSAMGVDYRQVTVAHTPVPPNCPEVQQGGYAGPTCQCTKEHNVAYEQARVGARDEALGKIAGILEAYKGRLQAQLAIIDQAETEGKYGDGQDQATVATLASIQRQGASAIAAFLSLCEGGWTDGANQYLYLVNAKALKCK